MILDHFICRHVFNQKVIPNYNSSQEDEEMPLKHIKVKATAEWNNKIASKNNPRLLIREVLIAVTRKAHEIARTPHPYKLYNLEIRQMGKVIPTMMKLAFVGKDFENVTHTCSQ